MRWRIYGSSRACWSYAVLSIYRLDRAMWFKTETFATSPRYGYTALYDWLTTWLTSLSEEDDDFHIWITWYTRPLLRKITLSHVKVLEYIIIARTYGDVIFDSEPLDAGVTQLHKRRNLEYNWVKPAENGSLSNTTTTYVSLLSCMLNLNAF